jgi:hypothetical protein
MAKSYRLLYFSFYSTLYAYEHHSLTISLHKASCPGPFVRCHTATTMMRGRRINFFPSVQYVLFKYSTATGGQSSTRHFPSDKVSQARLIQTQAHYRSQPPVLTRKNCGRVTGNLFTKTLSSSVRKDASNRGTMPLRPLRHQPLDPPHPSLIKRPSCSLR